MTDIDEILDRAEQTMKRCQRGTPYLDDAHSILADCYGTIGRLISLVEQHHPQNLPEGCTPADARHLREANHALADEHDRLRQALEAIAYREDVHTQLNQKRLCCEFQHIAMTALNIE